MDGATLQTMRLETREDLERYFRQFFLCKGWLPDEITGAWQYVIDANKDIWEFIKARA